MALYVTISDFFWQLPVGIQETTCTLVGNCIGANNVAPAKRFFNMTFKFYFLMAICVSLTTFVARHQIVAVFTEDEQVRAIVSQAMIIFSVNFIFDSS